MHIGVSYGCNQCEYKFTRQDHLTTHEKSIHEGVRYECDQCEYKSSTLGSMSKQKKSKHKGYTYGGNSQFTFSYKNVWKACL